MVLDRRSGDLEDIDYKALGSLANGDVDDIINKSADEMHRFINVLREVA